jgi:hypothetical protein
MKTIPFDINYYTSHPGCKVVDREGRPQRVFAVDLGGNQPIAATMAHDPYASSSAQANSFWSDGRLHSNRDGEHDLFIAIEPKLRAWKPEECPMGQFKAKGAKCWVIPLQTCFWSVVFWDYDNNKTINRSYVVLLESYEHSTDGGKTWLPCGVEE